MRTRTILAALAALLALLAAACGTPTSADLGDGEAPPASADDSTPSPDADEPADDKEGADDSDDDGQALPQPVAEMREEILAAARAGDYERLAEFGLEGRFTASFGGGYDSPSELADFWRREDENDGPDVDEVLIGLLGLDPYTTKAHNQDGAEIEIYVWPRAQSEDATDADREDLYDLFGEETVDGWYADGMYLGWRLGITAEGDWQFFVAGD